MRQFLLALALCLTPLLAQNLHIVNAIPFGASSLKIVFSNDIDSINFTPIKLNQNSFYIDIKAILDNGRKVYFFPRNAQVTIAQNTPQITRIVITNGNDTSYQLKSAQKNLYLSFVDKIPQSNSTTNPTQTKSNKDSKAPQPTINKTATQNTQKPATQAKPPNKQQKKQETPKKSNQKKQVQTKDSKQNTKPTQNPPPRTIVSTTSATPSNRAGIKVVIDAGHGGKDCGAMGITRVCEKHIVLKVALKVHNELKKRGYESYLTRDKDVYLNLPERTKFANAKKADLFVSIHANSVPLNKKSPKGIETYFLSTARSDRAREVSEQENKDDIEIMNFYNKQNFLDRLESHRLLASNKLAIDIQYGILKNLRANYQGITDNGVREGPFWVLVGALMPSVLVEIGYNSSPSEAPRLNHESYQRVLSLGIVDGIDSFVAKNLKE